MRRANRISPEPQSSKDAGSSVGFIRKSALGTPTRDPANATAATVNANTNEATALVNINSRRVYHTRRATEFRPGNAKCSGEVRRGRAFLPAARDLMENNRAHRGAQMRAMTQAQPLRDRVHSPASVCLVMGRDCRARPPPPSARQ